MKIAYLVLAHTDPQQCHNLIQALDSENATFFIHIDKKSNITPFLVNQSRIKSEAIFIRNRINVNWAGFSCVAATLLLLKESICHKHRFDRFVLLSGSSYPIKPRHYIESYFLENFKDYLDYFALPGHCWASQSGGIDRIQCFHFNDIMLLNPRNSNFIARKLSYLLMKWGRLFPRKIPDGIRAYGGSAWWALSRQSVKYILEYSDTNSNIAGFFRYTYSPDELFFQTILCNSNRVDSLENNNLKLILWEREHPAILKIQDWERIEKSEALFARKFDSKKSFELLQRINGNILEPSMHLKQGSLELNHHLKN